MLESESNSKQINKQKLKILHLSAAYSLKAITVVIQNIIFRYIS